MGGDADLGTWMETVAHRVEFLELLDAEGPLAPRDIVDAVDYSRPTVTRALKELREAGLVEQGTGGYSPTVAGRLAAEEYRRHETAAAAIRSADTLLAPIPLAHAPPVEVLEGAEVLSSESAVPVRALETVSGRVHDAETVRAYLPTLVDTHFLRVWHRAVVAGGVESEGVFAPDLLTVLKGQYPHLLAEMAAADEFAAVTATGPPYGIVHTSTDDGASIALVVYEAETAVAGLLVNDTPEAIEWGRAELDRLTRDSTTVTDALLALSPTVTDGMGRFPGSRAAVDAAEPDGAAAPNAVSDGHPLPVDLEAEGFRRLSADYFEAHGQAAPAISWRTGFTLAEVSAGHALDRHDEDGRRLSHRLVDSLQTGTDHAVLGPPGAGKSTVCMAVACEWYERELGPVLYRERGGGDRFAATALLEAYLRQADGHALVVVEDAVRDEANAILPLLQTLDADPTTTFLLDARTHEWENSGGFDIDARSDAHRRKAVEEDPLPAIDERECERFVAHYADLVERDLDISGAELYALVEAGTAAPHGEGLPAGDALIVQHHLVRRTDPLGEVDASTATALDEAVRQSYRRATEADGTLVADLALTVAVLTAAGIPVAPEYLYAIAGDDETDALEVAVASLEGRLLFESDPQRRRSTTYRTRHETWALRFLEGVLDLEPTDLARERYGRCVTRLLALADDATRREEIQRRLGGRTPHLHRIAADPGGWADELAERIFGIGGTDASLAPLFGETADEELSLPAACSAWTRLQQAYWRGKMYQTHGDLDRAEREFRTLGELAVSVAVPEPGGTAPAAPAFTSSRDVSDDDATTHRKRWRATSRTNLGLIASERGERETAVDDHQTALALFREIDDLAGEATCLKHLGHVAFYGSEYNRARRRFEEGLATARDADARRIEFGCLMDLGAVAVRQSDYTAGRDYFEGSLSIARDLGERREEAQVLNNLGVVATYGGDYTAGREYWEDSLAIRRDLGDRQGEADSLDNLGLVARKRGDHDRAREFHEEALAIRREVGYRSGEATSLVNLGTVALERGNLERAGDRFEAALDTFEAIEEPKGIAEARLGQARLALAHGATDEARDRGRSALQTFEELAVDIWTARSHRLLGQVAAAEDAPAEAAEHWRTALETFERIEAPPDVLETLQALVAHCREWGDIAEAREWCQRARTVLAAAPADTADRHAHWIEQNAASFDDE